MGCEMTASGLPLLVFGMVNSGREPSGLSIPKPTVAWEEQQSDFDQVFDDAESPKEGQGLATLGFTLCGPRQRYAFVIEPGDAMYRAAPLDRVAQGDVQLAFTWTQFDPDAPSATWTADDCWSIQLRVDARTCEVVDHRRQPCTHGFKVVSVDDTVPVAPEDALASR